MASGDINLDPTTTKYLVRATLAADGVVEKPDVVGAVFGQTEGLLGNELDLRDLQRSGRIGRIEVDVDSKKGKTTGTILVPSSLDKVETAILAAGIESIDRVGPCRAEIKVQAIEDVRVVKRNQIIQRAKHLLTGMVDAAKDESEDLLEEVRASIRAEELISFGEERLPAGPHILKSDAIIVVEGRNDVVNLLKHGIKNAIAVEGTSVPKSVQELTRDKITTVFVDGDRGGDLILKELFQTCEIDFVARAPKGLEVEELTQKQIMKSLRSKVPAEQYGEMAGLEGERRERRPPQRAERAAQALQVERQHLDRIEARAAGFYVEEAVPAQPPRPERPEPRREERREERRGPRPEERRREERRAPAPQALEEARPAGAGLGAGLYLGLLNDLSGKLQALFLDDRGDRVGEAIPVRDLADTLRKADGRIKAVVFDGVITQRLLDIASERGIATLVGVKTGNITKKPANVEVMTRADLERA